MEISYYFNQFLPKLFEPAHTPCLLQRSTYPSCTVPETLLPYFPLDVGRIDDMARRQWSQPEVDCLLESCSTAESPWLNPTKTTSDLYEKLKEVTGPDLPELTHYQINNKIASLSRANRMSKGQWLRWIASRPSRSSQKSGRASSRKPKSTGKLRKLSMIQSPTSPTITFTINTESLVLETRSES